MFCLVNSSTVWPRLRVELRDELVHPLLVELELVLLLEDGGAVRVDRILDRLALAHDEAIDLHGDLRLQVVKHPLHLLHGNRHGCNG